MSKFSAKIEIDGDADAYYHSLKPEAEESIRDRSTCKLTKNKDKLIIEVNAKDATAFRAIMTTLTGLMSVIENSIKVAKE